jgi:hypothetical protein
MERVRDRMRRLGIVETRRAYEPGPPAGAQLHALLSISHRIAALEQAVSMLEHTLDDGIAWWASNWRP